MTTAIDGAAFDAFMSKVDLVQSTISGLKDGTVSVDQSERVLSRLQPRSPALLPPSFEESKEQISSLPSYRSGPGVADDYTHYCAKCRLEHLSSPSSCSQCNGALLPRDERHAQLKAKVTRLQEEKTARRERRQRFLALKAARKQPTSSTSSSSSSPTPLPSPAWDDFEPSSSSDDEALQAQNPSFAALSADLNARTLRRQSAASSASHLQSLGNAAYVALNFPLALQHYSDAIAICRSSSALYGNRAAAHCRLGQWREAVQDATLVLDIWEHIERGDERRRQRGPSSVPTPQEGTVVKALMRRAEAHLALGEVEAGKADVERALELEGEGGRRAQLLRLKQRVAEEEAARVAEAQVVAGERGEMAGLVGEMKGDGKVGEGVCKQLTSLLAADDEARVAFRTTGGLAALVTRLKAREEPSRLLPVLIAALANDKNKDAVQGEIAPLLLVLLLKPAAPAVGSAATALAQLTEREAARTGLLTCEPPVLDVLLPMITSGQATVQAEVMTVLANLAYTAAWKTKLRERTGELTPALKAAMGCKDGRVLAATFSLLANLCTQTASHSLLTSASGLIPVFAVAVARVFRAAEGAGRRGRSSAVAVLLNLSLNTAVFLDAMEAVKPALQLMVAALSSSAADTVLCTRIYNLLAKVCAVEEWRSKVVDTGAVQSALLVLQGGVERGDHQKERQHDEGEDGHWVALLEAAVKLVAACCPHTSFPALMTPHVSLLPNLLASPSPFLAGNAALIVSSLASTPLLPTLRPTVGPLLQVMRRWSGREGKGQAEAANNAAVACARIAKDGNNLEVIRAHGGMALLASAGKRGLR